MNATWSLAAGIFDKKQLEKIKFTFPSEKFFTKRDLVTEEMEITTAKLEKVEYKFILRYLTEFLIIIFNYSNLYPWEVRKSKDKG